MKLAVVLASTAALVGALPQSKPSAGQKLPWINKDYYGGIYCGMGHGWFQFTEKKCGTENFCYEFDSQEEIKNYLQKEPQFKNATEYQFKSTQECMDAHEPKPAKTEKQAPPADPPKLPFIKDASDGGKFCKISPDAGFEHTDEACGTERFCEGFDDQEKIKEVLGVTEWISAAECLNAHELAGPKEGEEEHGRQFVE